MATASRELRQRLTTLEAFVVAQGEQGTTVGQYLAGLAVAPMGKWWDRVYPTPADQQIAATGEVSTLAQILATVDRVVMQDAASRLAGQERQLNITERDGLNAFVLLVQAQDTKRQQHFDGLAAAR